MIRDVDPGWLFWFVEKDQMTAVEADPLHPKTTFAACKSALRGADIGKGLASAHISRFLSQDTGQLPP